MAQRRRRRFNVQQNGKQFQILGYTQEQVERYLGSDAIVWPAARRRHLPYEKSHGWQIDYNAVEEIAKFFELRLPVYVRRMGGTRIIGRHRLRRGYELSDAACAKVVNGRLGEDDLYHHITLSTKCRAARASEVAWHELCHAYQAEMCIRRKAGADPDAVPAPEAVAYWNNFSDRSRKIPYDRQPIELEARTYEAFADEIACCVEA